jgi:hypothetical protein
VALGPDLRNPQVRPDRTVRYASGSQWFSYRWDGTAFVPAGPPVAITLPPSTLVVTAGQASITQTLTTLAVTVRNDGPVASDRLTITMRSAAPMVVLGREFIGNLAKGPCTADGCAWTTMLEAVAPGTAVTGNFNVLLTSPPPAGSVLVITVVGRIDAAGDQPDSGTANVLTLPIMH